MKFLVSELIRKKREGNVLEAEEIQFLIRGVSDGSIPDYQISAWLMAVFFKGMNEVETLTLTKAMKDSGNSLHWRNLDPSFKNAKFVDKHSTGGVGDKVSLILAPLCASMGLKVPMMSGRGLGFTGGTVDKLESISGFKMRLTQEEMTKALIESNIVMMSQSESLCPADRKLYALRDVTATVESLALITGSIVSKKWAAGVENIVYDVKCGNSAFMTTREKARALAESLVKVSKLAGMNASALITRMEEPLGAYIGNALEVRECVSILRNEFPTDHHEFLAAPLTRLCCRFAAEMSVLSGHSSTLDEAFEIALEKIRNGQAYAAFEKMLSSQGAVKNWEEKLPQARMSIPYRSPRGGFLHHIDSRKLGLVGILLKAGRDQSTDVIDPGTGIELFKGIGEEVDQGEICLIAHVQNEAQFKDIHELLSSCFQLEDHRAQAPEDLVLEKIV